MPTTQINDFNIALKVGYTVATLPATAPQGTTTFVTDGLIPTSLAAVIGGGAVVVPVFYNGTTWIVV